MNRNYFLSLIALALFACLVSCNTNQDRFSERVKIALRDVGNKLLLSQEDSTSLILPVKELSPSKFQLAFNNDLLFEPNTLVTLLDESLKTSKLPEYYIVEVIQCKEKETAYSYQMSAAEENTIIPCLSRYLEKGCYAIEVNFIKRAVSKSYQNYILLIIASTLLLIILIFWYRKLSKEKLVDIPVNYETIGSFKFYPQQNKLIKEAEEIALSKKECELLALFAERPNEIIRRQELTKKVWEDNGVFVGRSLDTYISKLRKKLQTDKSIKLSNVHGVGYKLEVMQITKAGL